jgi:hypothetical protein
MPDPTVTNQDLDNAAQGTPPEPPPAEPPLATPPPEPPPQAPSAQPQTPEEDNSERSRLGRRVKRLEDNIDNALSEMRSMLAQRVTPPPPVEAPQDDVPVTRRETWDVIREYESKKAEESQRYAKDYVRHLTSLGLDYSEEEFNEIAKEHIEKFNIRHSNDPKSDAERNFRAAENAILRKKLQASRTTKPNPLPGNKPTAPLGGPPGAPPPAPAQAKTKLDDDASHFAKALGLSEDWIEDALKGEQPLYLGRK